MYNKRFFRSFSCSYCSFIAEQSVDEHMVKYKGTIWQYIIWQHIKSKPIKRGFKVWYRCAPKRGYLYEFDIYTGRKEAIEFGLGASVVPQETEKLDGSFCRIFFDNIFTSQFCCWEGKICFMELALFEKKRTLWPEIKKGE